MSPPGGKVIDKNAEVCRLPTRRPAGGS